MPNVNKPRDTDKYFVTDVARKNNFHLIRYMMMSRQGRDPWKIHPDPANMYPKYHSLRKLHRDNTLTPQGKLLWATLSYIGQIQTKQSGDYYHGLVIPFKEVVEMIGRIRTDRHRKGSLQLAHLNMARPLLSGRTKQYIINPEFAHWIPQITKPLKNDMQNIITLKELHEMFFEREFYSLKKELEIIT